MNNFVYVNQEKIEYQLTRKNVKNINMRVKSDNTIAVSANRRVPLNVIEQFIISKANWIKSVQCQNAKSDKNTNDENHIYYLGERLNLIFQPSEKNNIEVIGSNLIISCSDIKNRDIILYEWFNKRCSQIFAELFDKVYEVFKPIAQQKPDLKIKTMKSRWGSCHTAKKMITLNSRLIHYPVPAIEYVVVHEFAHLLQPNHSAKFYKIVAKILPDYKRRRNLLKHSLLG